MRNLLTVLGLLLTFHLSAQVKIGDNPNSINSNSLLEMESTNKGFLPPRVALNSASAVAPLTGTVPAGMLVYSTGGTLSNGYYYWDGTEWKYLSNGIKTVTTKTANATLLKTENIVLASNDITLTLPAVTSANNGLEVTVKNIGTYTDLVTVQGNSSATIDAGTLAKLTRWSGQTFVVYNGNWVAKEKKPMPENILEINANSSWTTIDEAVEYLNVHMSGPTVIRLGEESYPLTSTVVVDLPYALTFQGASYGSTAIEAGVGLAGKPMFRCKTDCYFKMISFDATTLTNYGNAAGEDAIRFLGNDTYNEVKDCSFDHFYNTILDSTNAELWLFETDISNAQRNGILIHGNVPGVIVKVAETDFIACNYGVNLSKGSGATIQLASGGYYNGMAGDTAIYYQPSTFTGFTSISITGNSWNSTGKYIEGFDFTRTDGRDANVILENNAGVGDSKPQCFINVLNSSTTTSLTTQNSWYKVNWGSNTTEETTKWAVSSNKITFLPTNKRNGWVIISGNVSASSNSQNITVGLVKNTVTGTQYGATTIRTVTADQPFPFTIIVNLANISQNDYFELYATNQTSSGKTVKFQDIQWLVTTY